MSAVFAPNNGDVVDARPACPKILFDACVSPFLPKSWLLGAGLSFGSEKMLFEEDANLLKFVDVEGVWVSAGDTFVTCGDSLGFKLLNRLLVAD